MNSSDLSVQKEDCAHESPEYVRLSLAAAMTLGFVKGWFFRNARLRCVNLLLTYSSGCKANCAFCGLAGEKLKPSRDRKFIRVPWRTYSTGTVIDGIVHAPDYVGRVCISMITHPRAVRDTKILCEQINSSTGKSISILASPSVMTLKDLEDLKNCGADRIGVAIDTATPDLFFKLRSKPVKGPHDWQRYWQFFKQSVDVFGKGNSGVHLICGLGETEEELVHAMVRASDLGGFTHLFSFFPEKGSLMENVNPPSLGTYRRIQLARYLIDEKMIEAPQIQFDANGRIVGFDMSADLLDRIINEGSAFETSGCPGPDGKTACNRPYGNEKPGSEIRNFPFQPDETDIRNIKSQIWEY
jgi:biotin synthase